MVNTFSLFFSFKSISLWNIYFTLCVCVYICMYTHIQVYMYIKFSVVRNIFKLTSHRLPRPVFIQLWHVILTAEVLLGQEQAAVKLGPGRCTQCFWAGPPTAHTTPACKEGTAGDFRVCRGLCSVLRMGWLYQWGNSFEEKQSVSWRAHK